MAYFPFFIELSQAQGLVVGGGRVALRKIEKLLPYGPLLTAAAPQFHEELEELERSLRNEALRKKENHENGSAQLVLCRRPFTPEDLAGKEFVIAAAGDREVNHRVARLCRERRIPVNVVDDREASSFLFPSLIKKGSLSVGISTGGSSPSAAIYLKERFSQAVPENLPQILNFLAEQRVRAQQSIVQGERRERLMKELFCACMERGGPLTQEEAQAWIEKAGEEKRWEKEA